MRKHCHQQMIFTRGTPGTPPRTHPPKKHKRITLVVTNVPSIPGSDCMYEDRYYAGDELVKVVHHKKLRKVI